MKVKIKHAMVIVAAFLSTSLFAQRQTDIEGSKDYPVISRFTGSVIEFYKETKWGSYKLPVNEKGNLDWENPQILEGKVTRIQYTAPVDNNAEFVLQNYKKAFTSANFKILIAIANDELGVSDRPHTWGDKYYASGGYYNGLNNEKFGMGINLPIWKGNHSFIAAKGKIGGNEIYAMVYTVVCDNYTLITQDVVEVEAVETGMVTVNMISDGIISSGHIAIYDIHFETGQSIIKPESNEALTNIAEYLNSNKAQKFYVVGHTDNVGSFDANMKLSEARANAVKNELITKYAVSEDQLKAYGVSSLAPVASNDSDDGKAKNRRVEIVKQ